MELKPGYKQTEVGVIPEDWEACQLGRLLQFQNGRGFQQGEWSRTGLPIIRIQNLNDSEAEFNFFNGRIEERHLVQPGDLLFAWSGTVGSSFGPRIWRGETGVLNQHIFKVSPFSKMLSSPYALRLLESAATHIASQSHGFKASFVHVKKRDLEKIVAAFPPCKEEQKRICEALADIDAYLDATEAEVNKKRDIKQAAMQELLTGKRRLPGFEGEWEEVVLGDHATFSKGKGLPKSDLTPSGPYGCIHYGELFTVYDESIGETRSHTSRLDGMISSQANDVLMPTSDVTPYGLAKASCTCRDGIIIGGDILVIRPDSSRINGIFLSHLIRRDSTQILRLVTGTTVYHIYSGDMKRFAFSLPSISEQRAIVEFFEDIGSELGTLQTKLEKAKAIKQGMMQQLLTGKIRLK